MKKSFLILAATDLLLLGTTAAVGLRVRGPDDFLKHFLLGLLATIFTLLVHVVVYTYFMVALRVVQQALEQGTGNLPLARSVQARKTRALAIVGSVIGLTLVNATLGALVTEPGLAAAWGVSPSFHLALGLAMPIANLAAFAGEWRLIDRNGREMDARLEAA